jgi:multicomponent Na+:H+ antiporter subunit E
MKDIGGLAGWRPAGLRTVGFMALWVILSGGALGELLPGIVAAPAAAWLSLRLLPPAESRLAPLALCAWGLRFLGQSLLAGADVARRALDPALPLDPGFVSYMPGMAPGPQRQLFLTLTSLLPGTLPAGAAGDRAVAIHCLDRRQPVAAQLAAEEVAWRRALGRQAGHG